MKNFKIETSKVVSAYNVLSTAKYGKLDDADKIKVWKIARALKPVAAKFEEDNKDAAEKMKPEGFDEKLQNAQEYERVVKNPNENTSNLKMGAAEYEKFISELNSYNKLVGDAVREYAEKECEISFEPISEDVFCKLMSSNDWTMGQVVQLGIIIED